MMGEIDFQHLHHAYLVVGDKEAAEEAVLSLFEAHGEKLLGSPDFFVFRETLLGVDDARKLTEQAMRHAFTGRKVFLLSPEKVSLEAQNALLKTFEEPIADTHFFLILREESLVIPTLLSRMQKVSVQNSILHKRAEDFLALGIKERLNFVKKFVEKEQNLSSFLDELLLEFRKRGDTKHLEAVYKLRLVSDDRGASARLILEHLAAVL
ncbi:MAG: hypothetical protein AAB780_00615 [Patescibacteria group bacterium]